MNSSKLKKTFKLLKNSFKLFTNSIDKKELQRVHDELQSSYNTLKNYKNFLEQQIEEEVKKRQIQEKIAQRHAKLVAMGEMIDAIAHQWSQPLSIIDMHVNLMTDDFNNNRIDKEYIAQTVHSINIQKEHLISTLHKFRYFLNPLNKKELFDLNIMIKDTLVLLNDELLKNTIEIRYSEAKESLVFGSINEIKHVLINLINNSKDAFNSKKIKNRVIDISVQNKKLYQRLSIQDNAGGINKNIIKNIFKPYTSTKNFTEGSGIGLYMSQLIINKHNGKIRAKNISNGAMFIIKFYKEQ